MSMKACEDCLWSSGECRRCGGTGEVRDGLLLLVTLGCVDGGYDQCSDCDGSGVCQTCDGDGEIESDDDD